MPQTVYRPVPGYTDLYAGMDSTIVKAGYGELEQKIWKGKGYQYVYIPKVGSRRVYELIAAAFLGPRPPGMHVRHADGSKDNNALENLCYGTPKDNQQDSMRHGTHPAAANRARTQCAQGHDYTPENTYVMPNGHRRCRTCQATWGEKVESACRGDLHRRYITDDQRLAIEQLLSDATLSNRAIAKRTGVSHTTVRRYRAEGGG